MTNLTQKQCLLCKQKFKRRKSFCSSRCYGLFRRKRKLLKCKICRKEIEIRVVRVSAKCCSRKCKYIEHRLYPYSEEGKKKLSIALKKYKRTEEHQTAITLGLRRNRKFGSKSHTWKGGKTKLSKLIRSNCQMEDWRKFVFARDNWTCQMCGVRGKKLNADHIIPLSVLIDRLNIKKITDAIKCKELWDIKNGRTLCEECHKLTPTFKGKCKTYEKDTT